MRRTTTNFGNSHMVIETGAAEPDATTIVERKGLGHPDTLADHLAERLSRAYSRYTTQHFGAVLHGLAGFGEADAFGFQDDANVPAFVFGVPAESAPSAAIGFDDVRLDGRLVDADRTEPSLLGAVDVLAAYLVVAIQDGL